MRTFTLIFLMAFAPVWATNIGGYLSTNTFLDSTNNPYYVTSDIQVPSGVELHVGPGVELYFTQGTSIKVGGLLRMEGTAQNRILLSPDANSDKWGGIFFLPSCLDFDTTTQTGCLVSYVHSIRGGGDTGYDIYNIENNFTIKAILSTIAVTNSIFENNASPSGFTFTQGGYFRSNEIFGTQFSMDNWVGQNEILYFEDNYIHDITGNPFSPARILSTAKAVVKGNIFRNCTFYTSIISATDNSYISNNQITNCPGAWGLILVGGYGHVITNNEFEGNLSHIGQICERNATITNNCFGAFEEYAMVISANENLFYPVGAVDCNFNNVVTLDYSNNFFVSTDSAEIQEMIYDYYDDIGDIFICDVYPVLTSCPTNHLFSIDPNKPQLPFTVFPNPANDQVNIQMGEGFENGTYTAELVNNLGQVIQSRRFENGSLTMNISNCSEGLYYLTVSDLKKNLKTTEKIIIVK